MMEMRVVVVVVVLLLLWLFMMMMMVMVMTVVVCRFDPERFQEESTRRNFCLLGFSGKQTCPELR